MKNLLIYLSAFLCLISCGKDRCQDPLNPACENYDPCRVLQTEMGQGFQMYEGSASIFYPGSRPLDTVTSTNVQFIANMDAQSYEWRIGAGVYTSKVFNLRFPAEWTDDTMIRIKQTIPITLIQKRKTRPECITGDDGIDTFTRNLSFGFNGHFRIYGKFRGESTENPGKTYDIEISKGNMYPPYNPNTFAFDALDTNRVVTNFRNLGGRMYLDREYRKYNFAEFGLTPYYQGPAHQAYGRPFYMILSPDRQNLVVMYSAVKAQYAATFLPIFDNDSAKFNFYEYRAKRVY